MRYIEFELNSLNNKRSKISTLIKDITKLQERLNNEACNIIEKIPFEKNQNDILTPDDFIQAVKEVALERRKFKNRINKIIQALSYKTIPKLSDHLNLLDEKIKRLDECKDVVDKEIADFLVFYKEGLIPDDVFNATVNAILHKYGVGKVDDFNFEDDVEEEGSDRC